jgi:glycosyltransferase involved in cell wall biosynthesis
MPDKPHICFVSLPIWSVLSQDPNVKDIGGSEVQQTILARLFVKAGYKVSVITLDHGQPAVSIIDGINVYSCYNDNKGLPLLRFFYPRLFKLWATLKKVNADTYYQMGSGSITGIVAHFCTLHKKHFVFSAASDADFDPLLPLIKYGRDQWLYRSGLKNAPTILVQNEKQKHDCLTQFGYESSIIRSIYAVPENSKADFNGYILWVSSIRSYKRPELFLKLAQQLPQYLFRMIGGGDPGSDMEQQMKKIAATLPNVQFMGYLDYHEAEKHFNGARLFINTSEFEGFPNTFLQSWARGVPTISFFTTGSTQNNEPVIHVAKDLDDMKKLISLLMTNNEEWKKSSRRSTEHYNDNYKPDVVFPTYQHFLFPSHPSSIK